MSEVLSIKAKFILIILLSFIIVCGNLFWCGSVWSQQSPQEQEAVSEQYLQIDYPEYWPFFVRKENGEFEGFFYDIVTEALGRMGIKAVWSQYPWGRCQENVKTGEAHAMVTVPTRVRLQYSVTHEEPIYEKKLTVFTYVGHPRMKEIEAIASIDDIVSGGFSVVTYLGNGWNDEHIRARGVKTYETPRLENVWSMLAGERADIAIEWPGAAWGFIVDQGVQDFVVQTGVTLGTMPFHLLLRKECSYADRVEEFNKVILDMKRSGRIDEILRRYVRVN